MGFNVYRRSLTSIAIAVVAQAGAGAAELAKLADEVTRPDWLPDVYLEDYECRRVPVPPLVDWSAFRGKLRDLVELALDPESLTPSSDTGEGAAGGAQRKAAQVELLGLASRVLLHFQAALQECPLGAMAASLFLACLAHVPLAEVSEEPLPQAYEAVLADIASRPFSEIVERDLGLVVRLARLHVVAATEWKIFSVIHLYWDLLRPAAVPGGEGARCPGTGVGRHSSDEIRHLVNTYVPFASGKDIGGIKFLRGLDPLVTSIMRDPTEYTVRYTHECPPGAAAFALAAAMLALMSNPSLFERFSNVAHHMFVEHAAAVLAGAASWKIFQALAKLGIFATRPYDLVWSLQELLPLPSRATTFDSLRTDAVERGRRLAEAAQRHPHEATRRLAAFLASLPAPSGTGGEQLVYLTAVGGPPFVEYIGGFIGRSLAVYLPALVVACMDSEALLRCEDVVSTNDAASKVYCLPAVEGHVVLVKHAFIPMLLSAAVDTVWIDFDTFIFQDPTQALIQARDAPDRVLPKMDRIRYGSFLFDNASDMCALTKVCDARQHWSYSLSEDNATSADGNDVEMLVTEHWDARCLNNGLFYVRATARPLIFFVLFLAQLHANPYTDNQNLLDAFLAHSTIDAAAPESRPLLRYSLLDIEKRFACAEGHLAASVTDLVTFHFWSSDARTREVQNASAAAEVGGDAEALPAGPDTFRFRTKEGVERVAKFRASKSELFEVFFGDDARGRHVDAGVPVAAVDFIWRVKVPRPNWRGMCAVTAVGIEELVDERLVEGGQVAVDWGSAPPADTQSPSPSPTPVMDPPRSPDRLLPAPPLARCTGISLRQWAQALRLVGELEDASLLTDTDAALFKERLRRLDVGCLMTVEAFRDLGRERVARELRGILHDTQ